MNLSRLTFLSEDRNQPHRAVRIVGTDVINVHDLFYLTCSRREAHALSADERIGEYTLLTLSHAREKNTHLNIEVFGEIRR